MTGVQTCALPISSAARVSFGTLPCRPPTTPDATDDGREADLPLPRVDQPPGGDRVAEARGGGGAAATGTPNTVYTGGTGGPGIVVIYYPS